MKSATNQKIADGIKWLALKFWGLGKSILGSTLKLRAFNITALVTGMRTKALAVGGGIKGFAGALVGMARGAIPIAIGGLKALRIAVMTNPIGLIVGGIALAAGLIITYWKPIKGFFGGLWRGIVDQAKAALDWLLSKFEAVTGFIGKTWEKVTGWFGRDDEDEQPETPKSVRPSLGFKPVALAATVAATPVASETVDNLLPSAPPANAAHVEQPVSQVTHYNSYQITIHQQPGQGVPALADEMMREIERRAQAKQRRVLYD